MSGDKQIEEKDRGICGTCIHCYVCYQYDENTLACSHYASSKVAVGKWVDAYDGRYANQLYKCSVCGEPAYGNGKVWFLSKFCPSCGADMKGE